VHVFGNGEKTDTSLKYIIYQNYTAMIFKNAVENGTEQMIDDSQVKSKVNVDLYIASTQTPLTRSDMDHTDTMILLI